MTVNTSSRRAALTLGMPADTPAGISLMQWKLQGVLSLTCYNLSFPILLIV